MFSLLRKGEFTMRVNKSIPYFWMVVKDMLPWTLAKFQVIYSVVIYYSVSMMDYLFRAEKPSQMFLHNKTMLCNISLFPSSRVSNNPDIPISISLNFSFILRMLFGRIVELLQLCSYFLTSFFRAMLSQPV